MFVTQSIWWYSPLRAHYCVLHMYYRNRSTVHHTVNIARISKWKCCFCREPKLLRILLEIKAKAHYSSYWHNCEKSARTISFSCGLCETPRPVFMALLQLPAPRNQRNIQRLLCVFLNFHVFFTIFWTDYQLRKRSLASSKPKKLCFLVHNLMLTIFVEEVSLKKALQKQGLQIPEMGGWWCK